MGAGTLWGEPLFRRGVDEFNAERYFAAHESLERLWLRTTGPRREFLAGLILLAGALHQLKVKRYPSAAARLFARANRRWQALPAVVDGLDLAAIESQCRRCLTEEACPPRISLPGDHEAQEQLLE